MLLGHGATRQIQFALSFLGVYLIAIIICRFCFYRDPTSAFYDPVAGYRLLYSADRQAQGVEYIKNAIREPQIKADASTPPKLCVAIPSFAREGARYLKNTVGSILHGLDESERRSLHIILFIANVHPEDHPATGEGWMENVADQVISYNRSSKQEMDALDGMMHNGHYDFGAKSVFDYTYGLQECFKTGAGHVLLVEDDMIALDGWYHRTLDAIRVAAGKTKETGREKYLYLRLFWTERFFGWNSEEWPTYLFWSAVSVTIASIAYFAGIGMRPTVAVSFCLSNPHLVIQALAYSALVIIMIFAIGRPTIFPLPYGVHQMPKNGCCSQAFVYTRNRVPEVMAYLRGRVNPGPVDTMLEEWANDNDELRWALIPSVMQHVGKMSSKGAQEDTWTVFNYAFERNSVEALRAEHQRALEVES